MNMPAKKETSGCILENRNWGCPAANADCWRLEARLKLGGVRKLVCGCMAGVSDRTAEERPPPPAKPASQEGVLESCNFFAPRLFAIAASGAGSCFFAELLRPRRSKPVPEEERPIRPRDEAISQSFPPVSFSFPPVCRMLPITAVFAGVNARLATVRVTNARVTTVRVTAERPFSIAVFARSFVVFAVAVDPVAMAVFAVALDPLTMGLFAIAGATGETVATAVFATAGDPAAPSRDEDEGRLK